MRQTEWILLMTLSLLWGGSFLFVEVALNHLPPLTVVWARVALAALVLAPLVLPSLPALPKGALAAFVGMGLLNNAVPFTLFAVAQGQIDASLAAFVNATTPLWTLVVAHLATQDERITRRKMACLLLGLAGVLVLAGGGGAGEAMAIAACLGAALSYACAAVWGRRFRRLGVAPLTTAFGQVTASTLMLLPLWLMVDRPWTLPLPPMQGVVAVLGLATLSTALAYLIFFRLLALAGATVTSLVTFLIPVSAAGMGVLILDQPVLPRHLAGFALIATGLALLQGGRRDMR